MTFHEEGRVVTRCAPWITWTGSGTELVLFDSRDGSYHALNGSASLLWQQVVAGAAHGEIASGIATEHDLSLDVARESVAGFVAEALAKGLLVAD